MKHICLIIISILGFNVSSGASSEKIFQDEISYLRMQKSELQKEKAQFKKALNQSKVRNASALSKLEARKTVLRQEIANQKRLLKSQKSLNNKLSKLKALYGEEQSLSSLLNSSIEDLEKLYPDSAKFTKKESSFYNLKGIKTDGVIYSIVPEISFAQAKDNKLYKLALNTEEKFMAVQELPKNYLKDIQNNKEFNLLVSTGRVSEVPLTKMATFVDKIKKSGSIGVLIALIGLCALLLFIYRFFKVATLNKRFESFSKNEALTFFKPFESYAKPFFVLAAVAPLMGLLGTVTGMIGTFQVITEKGAGDPRTLSGGISEALLTTQFGLILAIPCLFAGHIILSRLKTHKNTIDSLSSEQTGVAL